MRPGEWIMVQGGWTPRQFADAPGGFTLEELDRVAPKNPLFVQEGYNAVYDLAPRKDPWPAADIKRIQPVLTMVGGRVVYSNDRRTTNP